MNNIFGILIVNDMLYNTLTLCLFQVVLFVEILGMIKKNLLINHVFSQAKPNFKALKKKIPFSCSSVKLTSSNSKSIGETGVVVSYGSSNYKNYSNYEFKPHLPRNANAPNMDVSVPALP